MCHRFATLLGFRTFAIALLLCSAIVTSSPAKHYVPPTTPYDKVAGNQYFKRDKRRAYPQTIVMTAKDVPAEVLAGNV